MKTCSYLRSSLLIPVVLALCLGVSAQGHPSGGGGGTGGGGTGGGGSPGGGGRPTGGVSIPTAPSRSIPNTLPTQPSIVFLSGKVVLDDGAPLTDSVVIESICRGQRHAEAYSDTKGNFSFQFGQRRGMATEDIAAGGMDSSMPYGSANGNQQGIGGIRTRERLQDNMHECELQAEMPGFTSQVIELSRFTNTETADVGRIVLHRLSKVEGLTVSATSAQAPGKAKKAFQKGREEEQKGKLADAEAQFQKAVGIYPNYAVAWVELGRMQVENKNKAAARESFQKAINADPKLVSPYELLTVMAVEDKQWPMVVQESDQVLRLNPISFPQVWFYNAAGHYFLQQFDLAEKSVRQGIKADVEHKVPKLEHLMGLLLAHKHDYTGALEHLRAYLRMAPNAPDASTVNTQIAEVQKLSGAPNISAAPGESPKK